MIWSHSKLATFEHCPLKYKFQYIDKLKPDMENTIEGFLGNKVHDTLEWIYKSVNRGNIPNLDEVVEYLIISWRKDFNEEIKIIAEDLTADYYFNKGIKLIVDYYTKNHPFIDNTIAIEKFILINLDPEGRYRLQGYIDRIVYDKETDTYEIHDYKTSRSLKTQEELDKDRQLALYSIAIKETFNPKDIHLVWHFLDFNKKMISKRTEEQLKKLREEIIQLIQKIESTTHFNTNPGNLCNWCKFKSHCPEWQ